MKKFSEDMIREAVDIAVGDDGFRSNEVIEILKHLEKVVSKRTTATEKFLSLPPFDNAVNQSKVDRAQSKDDYYMSLMEKS